MFFNKIILILFLSSCLMFSFFFKHILMNLISLEFMMINTIFLTYSMLNNLNMNFYFMFFILILMVSEGVMGLTILVYMIRNSGNDYSNIMKLTKW